MDFSPERGLRGLLSTIEPDRTLPPAETEEIRLDVWGKVQKNRQNAMALIQWAAYSAFYGRYDIALAALERTDVNTGSLAEGVYAKALSLIGAGKVRQGVSLLEEVPNRPPNNPGVLLYAAYDLIDFDRRDRAADVLGQLADSGSGLPVEVVGSVAEYLLSHGHAEQALPLIRELQRRLPDDPRVEAAAGFALSRLGRHLEAVRSLERAAAGEPAVPEFWGTLGSSAAEAGDYELSMSAFERALSLDPGYFDTRPEQRQVWEAAAENTGPDLRVEWTLSLDLGSEFSD